jgi:hypothetical protein
LLDETGDQVDRSPYWLKVAALVGSVDDDLD